MSVLSISAYVEKMARSDAREIARADDAMAARCDQAPVASSAAGAVLRHRLDRPSAPSVLIGA